MTFRFSNGVAADILTQQGIREPCNGPHEKRPPESRPKTRDGKPLKDGCGKPEEQRIDNKREKPERQAKVEPKCARREVGDHCFANYQERRL